MLHATSIAIDVEYMSDIVHTMIFSITTEHGKDVGRVIGGGGLDFRIATSSRLYVSVTIDPSNASLQRMTYERIKQFLRDEKHTLVGLPELGKSGRRVGLFVETPPAYFDLAGLMKRMLIIYAGDAADPTFHSVLAQLYP
jgi:hypothetical protein